jgi:hypothetical protein
MRTIERITEIDAPAPTVWDVLMDVDAYREWNPFLTLMTSPTHVGQRLAVAIRAGERSMTFTPTLTVFSPGRSICWVGRLLVPRVVDGTHELHVEPIDDRRSRFTHRETFRGVLVPFLGSVLRDTDAGFAAMNAALAERASRLAGSETGGRPHATRESPAPLR